MARNTISLSAGLGRSIVECSPFLENLSIAFIVDAQEFFLPFKPGYVLKATPIEWNFRSLALTSTVLSCNSSASREALLNNACRAAAFMPKLEIMELWDGTPEYTVAFLYLSDGKYAIPSSGVPSTLYQHLSDVTDTDLSGGPVIMCNFLLTDAVICRWSSLPNTVGKKNLVVKTSQITELTTERKSAYFSGIPDLRLRDKVADPVSQYQIYWENERERLREQLRIR